MSDTIDDLVDGEISIESLDKLFEKNEKVDLLEDFEEPIVETAEEKATRLETEEAARLEAERLAAEEETEEEKADRLEAEEAARIAAEEETEEEKTARLEAERLAAEEETEEEKAIRIAAEGEPTSTFTQTKNLIDLGMIEDVKIAISDDDEKGTLLSELANITDAQLKQVIELQKKKVDDDIVDQYISKDGLSEDQLRIIDIIKEGGNLKEIFQNETQLKRPFEGMDLKNEKVQKQIVLWDLMNNKKIEQKDALALLAQKEKDFEVDSYAQKVIDAQNTRYDDYLEQQKTELAETNKIKGEKTEKTVTDLTAILKENKIKPAITQKIVDGVTKSVGDNKFQVHKALDDILDNPGENYEVLLHLLDKEAFLKLYNIKSKGKETKNFVRLVESLPVDRKKKIAEQKKEETHTKFEEEILKLD